MMMLIFYSCLILFSLLILQNLRPGRHCFKQNDSMFILTLEFILKYKAILTRFIVCPRKV